MLHPRIIPCLLIKNKGLVKSRKFSDYKYVGDPLNAVKIFNEKESDELIVIDIDASIDRRNPDYKVIENLASECRMPLCYGGGIKSVLHANTIFALGVEKIAISSIAIENPKMISDIADKVGNQSVVVVLDVKKRLIGNKYDVYTFNASKKNQVDLLSFIEQLEKLGAGEIVVNSIDNDGMMQGYDLNLIKQVREHTNLPLTVLGGAGDLNHIEELISDFGIIGAAAGSLFVFKGKYRAVLINYPRPNEKVQLIEQSLQNYNQTFHL